MVLNADIHASSPLFESIVTQKQGEEKDCQKNDKR